MSRDYKFSTGMAARNCVEKETAFHIFLSSLKTSTRRSDDSSLRSSIFTRYNYLVFTNSIVIYTHTHTRSRNTNIAKTHEIRKENMPCR